MKKSDGEIHEKTASWGILQSEWLKEMWTAIIAVTLPFRYRMGLFFSYLP